METISVIIPTYNSAPWLPGCLASVLGQTYQNLEIIVVDDGSTDDTRQVLEGIRDPRLRVIHQENRGVTAARLEGVAQATGEWIGFVDSDDVVDPGMYARLMENALAYGADISHCGFRLQFPDGTVVPHQGTGKLIRQDHVTGLTDLLEERLVEPGVVTKLFRRELFAGLRERMDPAIRNNEDMLMNFYLFSRAEVSVFEDVCPYCYQAREGSASRRALNDHRIYDPIRVRQKIAADCQPQIADAAHQALLRSAMYMYAILTMERGREFAAHRRAVRDVIVQQRPWYGTLTRRNRILAEMIRLCPGGFHLAFRFYGGVLRRSWDD